MKNDEIRRSLQVIETLTTVALNMDWDGVESKIMNDYMQIQKSEINNLKTLFEESNTWRKEVLIPTNRPNKVKNIT